MKKRREDNKNKLFTGEDIALVVILTITIAGVLTLYILTKVLTVPLSEIIGKCILYEVVGIYCPACGGTRAFLALCQGNILQSLYYHPVVIIGTAFILCFIVGRVIAACTHKKINCCHAKLWWMWTVLGVMGLHFIVRNVLLVMYHIPI